MKVWDEMQCVCNEHNDVCTCKDELRGTPAHIKADRVVIGLVMIVVFGLIVFATLIHP